MTMTTPARLSATLAAEHRGRLMAVAREAILPQGIRLLDEDGRTDRFWIVRSSAVALDLRMPGRRPVVIETLGFGDLVGWSWPPAHGRRPGATAVSPVHAWESDAAAVRAMCRTDHALGKSVALRGGGVLAHRLHAARTRLLDLHAPCGNGIPG